MFSLLAKEDLEDLRAEGCEPTDEDIIRLHALAVRISDGPETTAYNAPRFALAGDMVIHQPTAAAFDWYEFAHQFAETDGIDDWMFAFACANGRKRGYLQDLRDPQEIAAALGRFIASCACTYDEMMRATRFAAMGYDTVTPEETELAKKRKKSKAVSEREQACFSALEYRISEAAAATGLTFDDIMMQTPSRLIAMINAAHVQAGMTLTRNAAAAHADYLATLRAISQRLRAERDARAAKPASETEPEPETPPPEEAP